MPQIPKRIANIIMNSLKGGVVPKNGVRHITVGRKDEIDALLKDAEIIEDGGSTFRFIVGKFGSGKSFLIQAFKTYILEKGYICMETDLSPERRLVGNNNQGLATYKQLVQNMSSKTKPDGGALQLILEKWISNISNELINENPNLDITSDEYKNLMKNKIFLVINEIESLVNGFDFAKVISLYWEAYINNDSELKNKVLKWLRGEYATKTEAKNELGISTIITDDNWYEYIKLYTVFLTKTGYKGLFVFIDELINLYKIPNQIARQYNYEKILTMYNDTLQGKVSNLGIIMCGTPMTIEDTKRGLFSYEALKSRLEHSRFFSDETRDLMAPIITLKVLTPEEIFVLLDKLSVIHADLYDYQKSVTNIEIETFINAEYSRLGAKEKLTPREIIRDFIEILNTLYQYPDKKMSDLIQTKAEETFEIDDTIFEI